MNRLGIAQCEDTVFLLASYHEKTESESVIVKVVAYVMQGGEYFVEPVSRWYVVAPRRHGSIEDAVLRTCCDAVATGGMNVFSVRDLTLRLEDIQHNGESIVGRCFTSAVDKTRDVYF